jgi:hypothetical protein
MLGNVIVMEQHTGIAQQRQSAVSGATCVRTLITIML